MPRTLREDRRSSGVDELIEQHLPLVEHQVLRLSGGFPPDAVRLQVFEAASSSLAAAAKLPDEPTSLFWDRTGLSAGDTRWYWLRAVSAEGNVSALAGPMTATAL